jgi:hypothetical protein
MTLGNRIRQQAMEIRHGVQPPVVIRAGFGNRSGVDRGCKRFMNVTCG